MSTATQNGAIELLAEIQHLMELQGENPFKIRAFEKAQTVLSGLSPEEDLVSRARNGSLTELPGIGKGISEVLTEFLIRGTSQVRDEIRAAIPPGLIELTQVPGLGPKKARTVMEELGVQSLGELEYACRENRLAKLKGFGDKLQARVLEGIVFLRAGDGQAKLADAFPLAENLFQCLLKAANSGRHPAAHSLRVSETGALRRRLEVLASLDFLIEVPEGAHAPNEIRKSCEKAIADARSGSGSKLSVRLFYSSSLRFGYELARLTATEEHWKALGSPAPFDAPQEEDFYSRLDLPLIPPEARETGEEVELARQGKLDQLLAWNGVQGIFHNHTVRSDGNASLEEMVVGALKEGYRYIGISDHSQSAFYAQGLKVPDLFDQEKEVRRVQEKYPEIRIFWGIESDILADGSLDYDTQVLKKFDFVIASIHSRFQMDRDTMTDRIIQAIRNPSTRFLGHATGRLLLGRPGYACDLERIISEAAKYDVAIEINASPSRLDIDWRWGPQLRRCGTSVSINPDAHAVSEISQVPFGIAVARKALIPTSQVINSRPVDEVARWLDRKSARA